MLESTVDRLGWPVARAGPVEVREHIGSSTFESPAKSGQLRQRCTARLSGVYASHPGASPWMKETHALCMVSARACGASGPVSRSAPGVPSVLKKNGMSTECAAPSAPSSARDVHANSYMCGG